MVCRTMSCGGVVAAVSAPWTLPPATSLSQNDERAISTATPHAPQRVPLAGTVLAVARTKRDITALGEHETSGYNRKTMKRCWAFLDRTSRSFAAVIKELDGDLARVVGSFPWKFTARAQRVFLHRCAYSTLY